jgi:hypothetical protein
MDFRAQIAQSIVAKCLIYMDKFESLINRLEKPKRNGFNVRARCPVHGSKGQTLSVTAKDGGYIVAHCFACGAGGPELVEALGLPVSILFPEDREYVRPSISRDMRRANIEDGLTIQMSKESETLEQVRQIAKARERVRGYEMKLKEVEQASPSIDHPALAPFRSHFAEALTHSSALRSELVDAFWQGVKDRADRFERQAHAENPS